MAELIPLKQWRSFFPGVSVSDKTLLRWAKTGVNGVVLDSIKVGRSRFTTEESIGRFLATLNNVPEQIGG